MKMESKVINISGYDCIFDDDTLTHELRVGIIGKLPRLVYSTGKYIGKFYSRILMDVPAKLVVDHRNGNTLDNRKENLRVCTQGENILNSRVRHNKKEGLPKGVTRHGKKYAARIRKDNMTSYLGTFIYIEDAEAAYKKAAEELHGQFAHHL